MRPLRGAFSVSDREARVMSAQTDPPRALAAASAAFVRSLIALASPSAIARENMQQHPIGVGHVGGGKLNAAIHNAGDKPNGAA